MKEYIQTMEEPMIGHLYTDPTLTFHQVFQLKRGVFRSLVMPLFSGIRKYGFGGVIEGARLGVEKSHISGDSWQQGGTVVLDKEARVIYKHQESHPADWPNMEEILPLVGIQNTSVEYEKAVSDWLEVRQRNRQQKA